MSRRSTAVAIVVLSLLGLTACTAFPTAPPTAPTAQSSDQPGDQGQSKEDACALIQQSIDDATGEFESIPTSDPAAVVEAMRSAAAELSETATQITNDEVAALVPSLQDMFTQVAEVMDAVVRGDASKVNELSELGEQFQATSEAFQQVCAP
jgi:hypothetical protein